MGGSHRHRMPVMCRSHEIGHMHDVGDTPGVRGLFTLCAGGAWLRCAMPLHRLRVPVCPWRSLLNDIGGRRRYTGE